MPESITEAQLGFALKLLQSQYCNEKSVVFSPVSIAIGIATVYLGAKGDTEKQIRNVLAEGFEQSDIHSYFSKLMVHIKQEHGVIVPSPDPYSYDEDAVNPTLNCVLETFNRAYINDDIKLKDDFVKKFDEFYEGGIEQVNFGKAVEVVEKINNFIAEVTRNKINNIVTEDDFTENDFNEIRKIVLINAIYFKGRWDEEFSSYETKDASFYMAPGKTKKAKMMQRLILQREYSETDEFQFLTLDYLNCDLSMKIILPRKKYGLADVITNLTKNELMKHLTKKNYVEVIVKMPKFEVKTQFDAIETLKSMGIKDLFDTNSNLEGMSNFKEILISSILHNAYICTDEKGTEAAAITVKDLIGYGRCPPHPPPKEFTADHPFMYLITDSKNNIYFCGVVSGEEFEDGGNGSVHQKMEEKISKNSVISFAKKIFGKRP